MRIGPLHDQSPALGQAAAPACESSQAAATPSSLTGSPPAFATPASKLTPAILATAPLSSSSIAAVSSGDRQAGVSAAIPHRTALLSANDFMVAGYNLEGALYALEASLPPRTTMSDLANMLSQVGLTEGLLQAQQKAQQTTVPTASTTTAVVLEPQLSAAESSLLVMPQGSPATVVVSDSLGPSASSAIAVEAASGVCSGQVVKPTSRQLATCIIPLPTIACVAGDLALVPARLSPAKHAEIVSKSLAEPAATPALPAHLQTGRVQLVAACIIVSNAEPLFPEYFPEHFSY